jgi:fluoride exporter
MLPDVRAGRGEGWAMAYLLAAVGGALGALARWGVAVALPSRPGEWPWDTLLVNLVGCLMLGLLLGLLLARSPDRPWLRPLLGTGVLGGFTTFSTFAVETVRSAEAGAWVLAVGYVVASVLGGVAAAAAGLLLGRAIASPPPSVAALTAAEEEIA